MISRARRGSVTRQAIPIVPTVVAALSLLLCLPGTAAPAAAAIVATHYRPSHAVHFDPGTYTGYRFSSTGAVTARKSATLPAASSAAASLRTGVAEQSGAWLAIANGIWAGYYIRESNRSYLPFTRQRLVAVGVGTHTGYRFDAAGRVIGQRSATLPRSSTAHASTEAIVGASATYLLVVDGIWAGYWVPVNSGEHLAYPPLGPNRLKLQTVASGFSQPDFVTNAADGSGRLFVVERTGLVRVISAGVVQSTPFLDLTGRASCCVSERGLLGFAVHPAFATHRSVYADYTDSTGDIIVAAYTAAADGSSADASTERVLLRIAHRTYANHDGGWIAFGPDGYLYIATGDGGGGGDPLGNAQNRSSMLGKLLRIDVDHGSPYAIPATNPFAVSGGAKEVFAYGLRNPWRDSFDRLTGDLFIGDVGQDTYEEIDRAGRGVAGQNYGWNVMEGFACYGATTCATSGKTLPIASYAHGTSDSVGCAVTGGYMYRGAAQPALQGHYLLADYCSGRIWTLYQDENVADLVQQLQAAINISSFGEGEDGEIYVTNLAGGVVYRVVVS